MSRDEFKSFRNAAIVLSGLAILAPAIVVGWQSHSAIAEIREHAKTAVDEVKGAVTDLRADLREHETWDFTWSDQAAAAINACCPGTKVAPPSPWRVRPAKTPGN